VGVLRREIGNSESSWRRRHQGGGEGAASLPPKLDLLTLEVGRPSRSANLTSPFQSFRPLSPFPLLALPLHPLSWDSSVGLFEKLDGRIMSARSGGGDRGDRGGGGGGGGGGGAGRSRTLAPLVATGALQAGVNFLSCSVAGREHFAGEFADED